ncbi:hypothetical protein KCU99_g265, partial [Aureobasidium melanogenum]
MKRCRELLTENSLDLFIVIFAKVQGSQAVQFPPKAWISIAAVPPVLFDSPVVCEQRVSMVVEGPFADNAVFAPGSMTCSRKLRISPVPFKSSDGNGLAYAGMSMHSSSEKVVDVSMEGGSRSHRESQSSSILLISAGIGSMGLVAKGIRVTGESGTLNWNGDEHGKSGGIEILSEQHGTHLFVWWHVELLRLGLVGKRNTLLQEEYVALAKLQFLLFDILHCSSDGISGGSLCCLECRARMNLRCSSSGSVGRSSGSTLDSVDILFCRVASISVLLEAQIQGAERARDRGHPIAELSEECEKIEEISPSPTSYKVSLVSPIMSAYSDSIIVEDESIWKLQSKRRKATRFDSFLGGNTQLWHNLNQGHSSNICLIGPCPQRLSRKINM